ncbi:hypothetical protein HSBAA_32440 [Vreelandella sulfidaeris]|uniref:FAD/NAD(P)-binding domain-containing protein n=1 Tax=Vreelandella sulfidaeris TaxID=115553 RepID=A0A455UCB1_9GAMM|nr:hypothetical protein HSBAA_32440 [Halomonas sulfidaeris]
MLEGAGVTLFNARARLVDANTVALSGEHGNILLTARKIVLATGGWPWVPDFPGSEFALDSNQIFDLDTFPKRFWCSVVVILP